MRACFQGGVYVCCLDSVRELEEMPHGLEARIDPLGKPCDNARVILRTGPEPSVVMRDGYRIITIDAAQYERLRGDKSTFYHESDAYSLLITKP